MQFTKPEDLLVLVAFVVMIVRGGSVSGSLTSFCEALWRSRYQDLR